MSPQGSVWVQVTHGDGDVNDTSVVIGKTQAFWFLSLTAASNLFSISATPVENLFLTFAKYFIMTGRYGGG